MKYLRKKGKNSTSRPYRWFAIKCFHLWKCFIGQGTCIGIWNLKIWWFAKTVIKSSWLILDSPIIYRQKGRCRWLEMWGTRREMLTLASHRPKTTFKSSFTAFIIFSRDYCHGRIQQRSKFRWKYNGELTYQNKYKWLRSFQRNTNFCKLLSFLPQRIR